MTCCQTSPIVPVYLHPVVFPLSYLAMTDTVALLPGSTGCVGVMFSLQPFHTLNNDPGTHAGTGNNFIEITLVIEYSNCTSENVTCAKVLCALLCLQTVLVSMSQDKDIYLKKKKSTVSV